ncbi:MAG TPA: glycoside hydrolase family 3 N-terminal domain-containing protein, partial [Polyangiaceae bacterium]
MRRCSSLRSFLLSGGLFSLLVVACGHEIPRGGEGRTSSSGNSTSTDTNAGGSGNTGNTSTGGTPMSNTDANACPTDVQLKKDIGRPGYTAPRDPGVATLLKDMSTEDKIKQLYGIPTPPWNNGYGDVYNDIERSEDANSGAGSKKVRGYRYRDAGRGANLAAGQDNRKSQGKDYSTAFPTPSIRAASWDMELEARVGEAMGDETTGSKNNMLLAPCMNIIRHPFWGRTQETYSEDMYHTGRMASAFTAGLQKRVVGCAKHFAANNIENGRDNQNAEMDEQTLREVYAQHFDMVIREGGVGCIMASYNSINGTKSTQNKHLLTEILRTPVDKGGMGYRGMVISDWWAMPGSQDGPGHDASAISTAQEKALEAFKAGLDIEVPWALFYGQLPNLVGKGITEEEINTAAGRVLEQKFRFGSVWGDGTSSDPWGLVTPTTKLEGDSITNNDANLALAEESAIKSAVLLKNGTGDDKVLPIKSDNVKKIAVIGMEVTVTVHQETTLPVTGDKLNFATTINVGDRGSSRVNPDPDK